MHLADGGAERAQRLEQRVGIAGQPVERPDPAVAAVGDELLDDAERRVGGAPLVLVPAEQLGDLAEAAER